MLTTTIVMEICQVEVAVDEGDRGQNMSVIWVLHRLAVDPRLEEDHLVRAEIAQNHRERKRKNFWDFALELGISSIVREKFRQLSSIIATMQQDKWRTYCLAADIWWNLYTSSSYLFYHLS